MTDPQAAQNEAAPADGDQESGKPLEASFLQFLSGLAAQTLMHLGAMSNPFTEKVTVDLVNAKYSIDLLGVLQEKTRGNLSEEEEAYLQTALTDLRMRYVHAAEAPNESADDPDSDAPEEPTQ